MTEQHSIAEILRTSAGPGDRVSQLTFGALGLAEETGEVGEMVKQCLFHGHTIDQERLCDELGDVLWSSMLICHATGLSLEGAMACNVEQLHQRYPHGFEAARSLHRGEGGNP